MDLKPFTSNQPKRSNEVQISNEKKLEVQLSNKFTYQIQWKETPHPHRYHNGGQTTLAKTARPSQAPRQHLVSLLQVLLHFRSSIFLVPCGAGHQGLMLYNFLFQLGFARPAACPGSPERFLYASVGLSIQHFCFVAHYLLEVLAEKHQQL